MENKLLSTLLATSRGLQLELLALSNKWILIWSLTTVMFGSFQGCQDLGEIVQPITAIFRHEENQPL